MAVHGSVSIHTADFRYCKFSTDTNGFLIIILLRLMREEKALEKKNYKRTLIVDEGLLKYINDVSMSDRDKSIVISYAEGQSYKTLAQINGITANRVAAIIGKYVRRAHGQKNINFHNVQ